MNDTIGVLPRVTDSELPAPEFRAPPVPTAVTDVRCPHCEAELRNAQVEAGQALRCLNCGKRFVPLPIITASGEVSHSPREYRGPRDIKTPGYWLLRAPAAIACFVACATCLMILVSYAQSASRVRFRDLAFLSYVFLLPVGGFLLLWITQMMAKVDAGMAALLERQKPGSADLPPMSGSSLPYILPLAVCGGIAPILSFSMTTNSDEMIVFSICGVALFFVAFALEDVRQFLWRQREFRARLSGTSQPQTTTNTWSILALSGVLFAMACVGAFMRFRNNDAPFLLMSSVGLLAAAYSLGRLDSMFIRVARTRSGDESNSSVRTPFFLESRFFWIVTCFGILFFYLIGHYAEKRMERSAEELYFIFGGLMLGPILGLAAFLIRYRVYAVCSKWPLFTRWMAMFPIAWATLGVTFFIAMWIDKGLYGDFLELGIGFLLSASAVFVSIWISDFLVSMMYWRRELERAANISSDSLPLRPYQSRFIAATILMVGVQALVISLELFGSIGRWGGIRLEEIFLAPLALGLFHYPTLWFLAQLRELWHAHTALSAAVAEPAPEESAN